VREGEGKVRGKHREDGLLPVKGRGMVSDSKRGGKERGREGDRETDRGKTSPVSIRCLGSTGKMACSQQLSVSGLESRERVSSSWRWNQTAMASSRPLQLTDRHSCC